MLSWIFGRRLKDAIDDTRKVRICGIRFVIRKINVLDHLSGATVLQKFYSTWDEKRVDDKQKANALSKSQMDKAKKHLSEVILAGVITPKIDRKDGGDGVCVDRLFSNWDMVNGIYEAIMAFSLGKKKLTIK